MAVGAPIGYLPLTWTRGGVVAPPGWPAGTQAGHVVIVRCARFDRGSTVGPRGGGWHAAGDGVWWLKLTAADLAAGPGVWDGHLFGMVTVPGARGIGATSTDRGVRLSEAGAGMLVYGWTERWSGDRIVYPPAGMLGTDTEISDDRWTAWWVRVYAAAGYQRIERDDDVFAYRAFEVLPARGPDAPMISLPAEGTHSDVAADLAVTLVHRSSSGMPQEARRVRAKLVSSGAWSYVTADGGLDPAVQSVSSASGSQTILAGSMPAGTWEIQAATMDGGVWSDWSGSRVVVREAAPTVTGSTLATTHNDLTPSASWVVVTPGGVQTAWRAVVVPAGGGVAEALADSGVQPGAGTSWAIAALDWVEGGSYELLVMVEQTGGLWSQWKRSPVAAITWDAPAAPTGLVFVAGSPDLLVVSGIAAASLAVAVEWASAGVDDWLPLAVVDAPAPTATVLVTLAPYGVGRRYRVCSWEAVDGVWLPSAYRSLAGAVASLDEQARLVDPTDTQDWVPVVILPDGGWTLEQEATVSVGLMPDGVDAEARASVDRTPAAGRSGTLQVLVTSEASVDELVAWVTRPRRRWVTRWSPEEDPGRVMRDRAPTVMTLAGKVKVTHAVQRRLAARIIDIPWIEQ